MPILAKDELYRITTGELPVKCPICPFETYGGSSLAFNDVCNHVMTKHSLPCLHVGQESDTDSDGKRRRNTVAVFGK